MHEYLQTKYYSSVRVQQFVTLETQSFITR